MARRRRRWTSVWLPALYQGTPIRSEGTPVFNLEPPADVPPPARANQLRFLDAINRSHMAAHRNNPELAARIRNFEIAARMQTSVTEVLDLSKEPDTIFDLYGPDSRKPGTFAANCLLARRLAERGVRFIQLYHQGWDHHGALPRAFATSAPKPIAPAPPW